MKAIYGIIAVSFLSATALQAGDLVDTTCEKIQMCDSKYNTVPDWRRHCRNFFNGLDARFPGRSPFVILCVDATPCEILSFQECTEKHVPGLKELVE